MKKLDVVWAVGRVTMGAAVRGLAPLRIYGSERVPADGGVVLAMNHFSWLDPPAFGSASPRTVRFLAKIELHHRMFEVSPANLRLFELEPIDEGPPAGL